MAFIVEDGTIVEDANSLVDLLYADAFWLDSGSVDLSDSWTAKTNAEKEKYLIKATYGLCREFRLHGDLIREDQALCMPRCGLFHCSGRMVKPDEVPDDMMQAVCIIAMMLVTDAPADYLKKDPKYDKTYGIKRVQDHDVEIAFYDFRYLKGDDDRSKYPEMVYDLMKCFSDTGSQAVVGSVNLTRTF